MIRETRIEKYLLSSCREHGVLCLKCTSPGRRGVPDRLLIAPSATFFVELKSSTGRLSPQQHAMHEKIRRAGGVVHVINSLDGVDELIASLTSLPLTQEDTP